MERDDPDPARAEGLAMGGVGAAEAEGEADAHVGQQVRVEVGAEVAAVARIHPLTVGRDIRVVGVAEDDLAWNDGAEGAVVIAAHAFGVLVTTLHSDWH